VCAVYSAGKGSWCGVLRECVCCIQCREGQLVRRIEGICVQADICMHCMCVCMYVCMCALHVCVYVCMYVYLYYTYTGER
jgi:hypothetical protein